MYTRSGLSGLIPTTTPDYTVAPQSLLVQLYNQFLVPPAGQSWPTIQSSVGDPYFFWGAVARGLVDNTLDGFFTLAATSQKGLVNVIASGATWAPAWVRYIQDYQAAMPLAQAATDAAIAAAIVQYGGGSRWMSMVPTEFLVFPAKQFMAQALNGQLGPLPIPVSNLNATNAVWNGVTNMWVPLSQVLASGTEADGTMFLTTANGTWKWAGPGYVAPVAVTQVGQEANFILDDGPGSPSPGPYAVRAWQLNDKMSNGTVKVYGWMPYGGYLSLAQIQQMYGGPANTVNVRFVRDVPSAEMTQINAAIGYTPSWTDLTATPPAVTPNIAPSGFQQPVNDAGSAYPQIPVITYPGATYPGSGGTGLPTLTPQPPLNSGSGYPAAGGGIVYGGAGAGGGAYPPSGGAGGAGGSGASGGAGGAGGAGAPSSDVSQAGMGPLGWLLIASVVAGSLLSSKRRVR